MVRHGLLLWDRTTTRNKRLRFRVESVTVEAAWDGVLAFGVCRVGYARQLAIGIWNRGATGHRSRLVRRLVSILARPLLRMLVLIGGSVGSNGGAVCLVGLLSVLQRYECKVSKQGF